MRGDPLAGATDCSVEALGNTDDGQGDQDVDDLNYAEGVIGERELLESDDGQENGEDDAEDSGDDRFLEDAEDGQCEDYGGDKEAASDVGSEIVLRTAPQQHAEDDGDEGDDAYQHDEDFCQFNAPWKKTAEKRILLWLDSRLGEIDSLNWEGPVRGLG